MIPYEEGLQSDSNKKSAKKPGGKKGGLDGDSDASATVMSGMGYTFVSSRTAGLHPASTT